MSNKKCSNADMEKVQAALDLIGEHFDSVMIFANRAENVGTINVAMGCGNWFARYGHVRDWIIKEDEKTRIVIREDAKKDESQS